MNKLDQFFKIKKNRLALPLISGVFVGTSYIPFFGWALLFCYVPLFIFVLLEMENFESYKQIFKGAWITQFVLSIIGFNWVYYVTVEFGDMNPLIGILALLAFAAFIHLYIPIAITGAVYLIRKLGVKFRWAQLSLFSLSMILLERIWPSIFEWNLGYSLLWMKWPIYQWADVVGFWGLSAWLLLIQAAFTMALVSYHDKRKNDAYTIVGAVVATLVVLTITGSYKEKTWSKFDQSVKIGVAQGNVGNAEKRESESSSDLHSRIRGLYTSLTGEIMQKNKPDIVIWPETAMPLAMDDAFLQHTQQSLLLQNVQSWGVPLVTGAYSIDSTKLDENGNPTVVRNALFYLNTQKGYAAPPYYKTNLLAFGEYMPLGNIFPFLYKILPFVGTYAEGSGPVIADVPLSDKLLKLGPQICYDSLNPGFSRDLAKNGAQVLFNITNDSWFGWWAEPFQHQYMTLARGVENRRPLVRVTNTGITSAVLANGDILELSPIGKPWSHTFDIKYRKNPSLTVYSRFGYLDWILWLGIMIYILVNFRTTDFKADKKAVAEFDESEFEIKENP